METVVREKRKCTKSTCGKISSNDTPTGRRTPSQESGSGGWQSRSSRNRVKEGRLAGAPGIGPSLGHRLKIERLCGPGPPASGGLRPYAKEHARQQRYSRAARIRYNRAAG